MVISLVVSSAVVAGHDWSVRGRLDVEQGASAVADGDAVVAAEGVDLEPVGRVAAGDAGLSRQPGHLDRAAVRRHVDPVGLVGAVHLRRCRPWRRRRRWWRPGRCPPSVTSVPLRSPIVTVSTPPKVARSSRSTPSRSIRMLPEVAQEDRARAVGRQGHQLVAVGAVEGQGVPAEAADDRVVALAGVPGRGVVAVPEHLDVGADAAVDEVGAVAADHEVGPGPPRRRSSPVPPSRTSFAAPVVAESLPFRSRPSSVRRRGTRR